MNILSFIKRKIFRISRDRWNYQYQQGQWQGLQHEQARFEVVIDFLKKYTEKPSILEVGCGEALLLKKMEAFDYKHFTGIDLSDVAIQNAQSFAKENTIFEVADMETYQPAQSFDVIIFTESLYYAQNPAQLLQRYTHFLNKNGVFIISAVQNKYTTHLWNQVESMLDIVDSQVVTHQDIRWDIRVCQ